jgi:hypothetical protein
MIEPRVYRAAFVPALLALVLAMFSFESRPRPLPQGLAADVLFDGNQAADAAAGIAEDQPNRRPGSRGDRAIAARVAETFRRSGFRVERQRFTREGRSLENVLARRAGRSQRQIVIVASRDAATVPEAPGSAADTAALMQLARVFQGRATRKTLVLASLDGSTLGEVGADELLGELPSPSQVDAVLAVSDLGSRPRSGSFVQAWSESARRAGIGLQRTVAESIRQELDRAAEGTGVLGQLARLGFPIGIGPQGVLLEAGYDAVRISGSGELPPVGNGPVAGIDEDRLGTLGRATLRTVTAVDRAGTPEHGPESYLLLVSQVLSGWIVALLAGALLLPALVAAVDAFARARRRGLAVAPWLRWMGAWTAPFLAAFAVAQVLVLTGATPIPPPAPVPPAELPLDGPALAVLGGVLVGGALAFVAARFLAARPEASRKQPARPAARGSISGRDPAEPGAAVALALVLTVAGMLLWLLDPYAGLLAVPAAHLWMLVVLSRPLPGRRTRALMVLLGLLPPLLVAIYYLVALSMNPLEGAWYLLMLLTGHAVGLATAVVGCVLLGALGAVVELAVRLPERPTVEPPRVAGPSLFGPGTHAGRGSLGGTESTLP